MNRTYMWSFVTQIFLNDSLGHGAKGKTYKVMMSTSLGTIG